MKGILGSRERDWAKQHLEQTNQADYYLVRGGDQYPKNKESSTKSGGKSENKKRLLTVLQPFCI